MNFTNVRLILAREIRDQLRDRRTLFMIFVLPVLLYPLLGTAYFQMIQFQTRKAMTVLVVGGGQLASAPTPLIEDSAFSPQLFPDGPSGAKLLKLEMAPEPQPSNSVTCGAGTMSGTMYPWSWSWSAAEASRRVQAKDFDAALIFPPDFAKQLEAYRKAIHDDAARVLAQRVGGEQGAGSREQGAGSREQGARSKERRVKAGWHADYGYMVPGPALPG